MSLATQEATTASAPLDVQQIVAIVKMRANGVIPQNFMAYYVVMQEFEPTIRMAQALDYYIEIAEAEGFIIQVGHLSRQGR